MKKSNDLSKYKKEIDDYLNNNKKEFPDVLIDMINIANKYDFSNLEWIDKDTNPIERHLHHD